jgi:hypothetical protein
VNHREIGEIREINNHREIGEVREGKNFNESKNST